MFKEINKKQNKWSQISGLRQSHFYTEFLIRKDKLQEVVTLLTIEDGG